MINQSDAPRNFGRRVIVQCVALVALVVLAAACQPPDASQYDEATSEPSAAATVSDDSQVDSDLASPLLGLIGVPLASDEAIDDYYNELYVQAEHQIAECMVAQGFEYMPLDYSQLDLAAATMIDTREYAEDFGFGITSLEEPADIPAGIVQEFDDPNASYFETLTAGERAAFEKALYGNRAGSKPDGCQHEAFDEAFGFFVVFEEFGYADEEIQDAVNADPRIVEAQTQWGVCMAEAGYNYADRADAESAIQDRLVSILSESGAFANDTLNSAAERQIDLLAAEERATAVVGWECTQATNELKRTVERELEQRLVDEHGAAIVEAISERSGRSGGDA